MSRSIGNSLDDGLLRNIWSLPSDLCCCNDLPSGPDTYLHQLRAIAPHIPELSLSPVGPRQAPMAPGTEQSLTQEALTRPVKLVHSYRKKEGRVAWQKFEVMTSRWVS